MALIRVRKKVFFENVIQIHPSEAISGDYYVNTDFKEEDETLTIVRIDEDEKPLGNAQLVFKNNFCRLKISIEKHKNLLVATFAETLSYSPMIIPAALQVSVPPAIALLPVSLRTVLEIKQEPAKTRREVVKFLFNAGILWLFTRLLHESFSGISPRCQILTLFALLRMAYVCCITLRPKSFENGLEIQTRALFEIPSANSEKRNTALVELASAESVDEQDVVPLLPVAAPR